MRCPGAIIALRGGGRSTLVSAVARCRASSGSRSTAREALQTRNPRNAAPRRSHCACLASFLSAGGSTLLHSVLDQQLEREEEEAEVGCDDDHGQEVQRGFRHARIEEVLHTAVCDHPHMPSQPHVHNYTGKSRRT